MLMAAMTDPSEAMRLFQQALAVGQIPLQKGDLDQSLFMHVDQPNGHTRFTYVRLNGLTVVALVMFVVVDPLDGLPCFQIGYAVPEAYRGQGQAKGVVRAGIAELKNGLSRAHPGATFYVEAVVGSDNEASKRVAESTISTTPDAITDSVSGLPALHYVRKV
jgi:hypothetical protein